MSNYGPERISMDTIEGLPEVDDVNKKRCVPLYALLTNVSQSKKKYSDRLRSCLRTSYFTDLTGEVENRWNTIKDGFCKAAESTLKNQGVNKKDWIAEKTWASVEERAKIRAKLFNSNLKGSLNDAGGLSL